MVTIINYKERKNEEQESFFVLVLQGGIEMVKSQDSNRYYATAKRATISSTFDELTCKNLIGAEMPGKIKKVETDPYEYTIEETGEVLELDFRYEYQPEGDEENLPTGDKSNSTIDDFIMKKTPEHEFSSNGV